MPILIGATDINDIYIGSDKIENIYIGPDKVWSRPYLLDLVAGYREVSVAGVEQYGFLSGVIGSLALANLYLWWNNPIESLRWDEYEDPSTNDRVVLTLQNAGTLNLDSNFTTMTVNGTTFNRADADTYINSLGAGYTSWEWYTTTNPFGSTGSTNRVRFERD